MISVILIEPEHPSNIGAIARVMANFGLSKLILVNPKCNHLEKDAILRAKHASAKILKNAKIEKISILEKFDKVIGTTAIVGTDYNISRAPVLPDKIKNHLSKNTAIVFGREGKGLLKKELGLCDVIVSIPTSKKYKTMNISHAAAVIFYEIFRTKKEYFETATKKQKQLLLKEIGKKLDSMKFSTKEKKETQKKAWKRIIGKTMITKREIQALFGFFKKL